MTRTDDAASIHAALDGLMMDLHRRSPGRAEAGAALSVIWRTAVGEFVARHALPMSLSRGLLRVQVGSSSLREELLRLEPDLVGRLNCTGRLKVTSLQIEVVPHFERLRRFEPAPQTAARPSAGEAQRVSEVRSEDMPAVREELRPTIHRLWALHRQHQQNQQGKAPSK